MYYVHINEHSTNTPIYKNAVIDDQIYVKVRGYNVEESVECVYTPSKMVI